MKNKEKYSLHFRNDGIPFVIVELMFDKKGYGQLDYIVLYKNTLAEGYLTEKGLKQAKKLGLSLLKNDKIYNKLLELKNKLENSSLDNWKDIKLVIEELGRYYLYCEQPILAGIEEIFLKKCKTPDLCLKHPEKCTLKGKARKTLDVLIRFGKMKYDLHVLAEKPIINLITLIQNFPGYNYLTENEIDSILSGKKIKFNNQSLSGIVISKNKIGYGYDAWKKTLSPNKEITEIKGIPVSPGKVTGKVKLFLGALNTTEIPKGSILVTGMTNPQMLPFLKNVSAIVTDEGGITSHAAIISREFHIPCIVGTKIATQILKNGDLVELDADKGTVKILKKA